MLDELFNKMIVFIALFLSSQYPNSRLLPIRAMAVCFEFLIMRYADH